MKKKSARILALTLALTSALALTGCGTEAGADDTTIRVGASPAPHAEVLEVIADNLEEEGYTRKSLSTTITSCRTQAFPKAIWTPTISSTSAI